MAAGERRGKGAGGGEQIKKDSGEVNKGRSLGEKEREPRNNKR